MNRDTVLSLIAGNRPSEVTFDWHFVSSLLTFGVVPLLGLIGTQVPAAGELLSMPLPPYLRLGEGPSLEGGGVGLWTPRPNGGREARAI
jgi:hypothetical protein